MFNTACRNATGRNRQSAQSDCDVGLYRSFALSRIVDQEAVRDGASTHRPAALAEFLV
jgi:hypothetical protein